MAGKTRKYKPSSLAALEELKQGKNVSKERINSYVKEGRITQRQVNEARAKGTLRRMARGNIVPADEVVATMSSGHIRWANIMDAEEDGRRARERPRKAHANAMAEMKQKIAQKKQKEMLNRLKELEPQTMAREATGMGAENYPSKANGALMTRILRLPTTEYTKFERYRDQFTKNAKPGKTRENILADALKIATRNETQKRADKRTRNATKKNKNKK